MMHNYVIKRIEQKGMTLVILFPFPLKKRGKKNSKNRDQMSCLSARSIKRSYFLRSLDKM